MIAKNMMYNHNQSPGYNFLDKRLNLSYCRSNYLNGMYSWYLCCYLLNNLIKNIYNLKYIISNIFKWHIYILSTSPIIIWNHYKSVWLWPLKPSRCINSSADWGILNTCTCSINKGICLYLLMVNWSLANKVRIQILNFLNRHFSLYLLITDLVFPFLWVG